MATGLPILTGVRHSPAGLNLSRIAPERVHHHRSLPVVLASPCGASASASASPSPSPSFNSLRAQLLPPQIRVSSSPLPQAELQSQSSRQVSARASSSSGEATASEEEEVFFEGGVHDGDLLVNLLFGVTLVWLPLTLTAVSRKLFLRYRFSNLRVTVQSGILGRDRKDFSYDLVKSVKVVPRFIGEWGDMAIELKDNTIVTLRSVPRFREIASYVEEKAAGSRKAASSAASSGKGGSPSKGFSSTNPNSPRRSGSN